jgi:hypothetical protein
MSHFPSREEIVAKLDCLCAGLEAREQVAAWAMSIIDDDDRVTDRLAWSVMEGLGAADLPAPDRDYLFTVDDFRVWKAQLLTDGQVMGSECTFDGRQAEN